MGRRTTHQFRYRSLPTATSEEIVGGYGDTHLGAQTQRNENGLLLSEMRHLQWEDFELFSATHLNEARISMRHADDVIAFLLPSEGEVEVSLRSRRILSTNGAIAVPRSHCREIKLAAGKRQVRLGISSRRFQKHFKSIDGQASYRPVKFDEAPTLDARMLACLVNLIDAVFHDVENSNTSRTLLAHKIESIEICILAVWPNSLWHNISDGTASIAPRHVRSAITIINSDPFKNFSITDLAESCNVSVRALQYGFRQFTHFTISEFITRSRVKALQEKIGSPEYIDDVRRKIGRSAFRNLNTEYSIQYGRDIYLK